MSLLTYTTKLGAAIEGCFEDLAHLRIEVFRDFPYLYEGSIDYEREYLKTYSNSERALLFAVYDQQKMVGATTCIPLTDETKEVQEPFVKAGYDLSKVFYFGESILLRPYRGQRLGHKFFDVRESHAASFGEYDITCFCAVVRPEDHPLKPQDYRPNDQFWLKRGYTQRPELTSLFDWTDLGETTSTSKPMVYWTKSIQ